MKHFLPAHILSSVVGSYLKGIIAGVSVFFLFYLTVPAFHEYVYLFGGVLKDAFFVMDERDNHILIDIFLCLFSAGFIALYTLSFYARRELLAVSRLHRFDYFFTVLGAAMILMLITLFYVRFRYYPIAHIILFACSFITVLHLWTTTIIRINTQSLGATVYWKKVIDTLPASKFSGFFVIGAVGLTTSFFAFSCADFVLKITRRPEAVDLDFIHWLHSYIHSICAPYAVLIMIAVFCRDILRRITEKNRMAKEKSNAERLRAELITNVTHDIRTPLTTIISYVDLIGKLEIDSGELREYTNILARTSGRLKTLVDDLLEASKASAGNIEFKPESIDLIELVGQVAGCFDEALTSASLYYTGPSADNQIFIMADGSHIWRVLENVFSNATKYAKPGTRLYATVREMSGSAELCITNISRDKIDITAEELMQQFVRSEQARHTEGSGLGLFIAERLTELMGGTFTITINGDRFKVLLTLPSAPAIAAAYSEDTSSQVV
ncbi:MAG: HAMP domain-containing histidine kinase [Clostridiales Family XIII bacterium]|jgi:signal transduction histidine kinase|nr:HAMP domain-containing histidine kinase [Clostridiales Family XIII bacterium]